jgi:hypothetical protein
VRSGSKAFAMRQRGETQHAGVLFEQRGAEPVQRVVVAVAVGQCQQFERRVERGLEVAAHRRPVGGRPIGCAAPPGIGHRFDRGQRCPRGAGAARTLHVASDPALLPPADAAGQAARVVDALEQREPGQRAVARLHQRQRQQLAVGMAHGLRVMQRGIGLHRAIVRDGRPASVNAT